MLFTWLATEMDLFKMGTTRRFLVIKTFYSLKQTLFLALVGFPSAFASESNKLRAFAEPKLRRVKYSCSNDMISFTQID